MQLFFRTAWGPLVTASAKSSETIEQVKSAVFDSSWPNAPQDLLRASRVWYGGRHCPDEARVSACGLRGGETLELGLSLRGGGGDGGATGAESRDCYLSMYLDKKPDKVDPNEARLAKWMQCKLSGVALAPPCAVDFLGNLFNKEAVIQALVSKSMPSRMSHLRGLRDIVTIHLTENPATTDKKNGSDASRFHCPITGLEFNGLFKFYALRSCGHVLSARALKEVQTSACLVCHTPFEEHDKITINGTEAEVDALRVRMEQERAKSKVKGSKKEKKTEKVYEDSAKGDLLVKDATITSRMGGVIPATGELREADGLVGLKRKSSLKVSTGIVTSMAAGGERDPVARPKGSDRVEEPKRFKASNHVPEGATKSVYSSIFVSSRKETSKETYSCRNLPIGRN